MTMTKINIPILDLKAQYQSIATEVEAAVIQVLRSTHYVLGPNLKAFEEESAKFLNSKYAIGCANGSDALYLALLALDVKPGDEVITTPFTYVATAEAITQIGARPVFADIDLETYNICPNALESKITNKTKAIIVVHLYGQACKMNEIMAIAQKHNLKVVEDTAQAFGTKYQDKYAGTIGDIGTYSFYPTKNFSCAGDGGMLTTNNDYLAERLTRIRAHGSSKRYYHDELGVNSRLDEIQVVILRVKLRHINAWNHRRAIIANRYTQTLNQSNHKDFVLHPPKVIGQSNHIYHQYTMRIESEKPSETRDMIKAKLAEQGINTEIYYPLALHMQKLYLDMGHKPEDFPSAYTAAQSVLCLPVYPELKSEHVDYICEALTKL